MPPQIAATVSETKAVGPGQVSGAAPDLGPQASAGLSYTAGGEGG